MKYRAILLFIIGIFLISHIYAWNFEQLGGGGTGTTVINKTTVINNFTINSTTVTHNDLDGLQGGVSGEYYHIRAAWYNTLNSDINDWITDTTNSLTNYYTKTETNAINDSVNNYIASVIGSETNWNANYSQFLLNNESLTNYINSNNDSLVNYILYVNSTNSEGQVDTFIANYSQFLLNNESLTNYIAENNQSVINYIALVNTSMKNYVDSLSSYDDTWINSTIDNKILEQNNSLVNYILIQNNSLINYYLEQNGSLINYIAVVNESMKNYVDYQISLIGNYDDSWINSTIDNKISTNNASVVNWANSIFATISALSNYVEISNIVNLVGNWSADKSDYYTSSQVDDVNTSMKNYVNTQNTSVTNALNTKLGISQWNATNTSYALLTELNNGSYLNVDTNIGNWTADKSSYTLLSVLNNGSYLNPEGTDTFIGNYSTFLTHITYDDVMNGTLKDYFDGLYIGIGTETESKWNANYSTFLLNNISITNALNTKLGISQWNATNTSYALLTELNNGSYLNVDTNIGNWTADKTNYYTKTEVNAINTSMKNYVDWVNSTNGVGGEGSYDDSWINDTIDTKINAELISYDETKNIEILEWMSQRNISINNYINNTFNTTRNNYVAFVNTSMKNYADTKLSLSGGTMTGNISLGTSGVRLTNGTTNTAVIYHNGTGWIIRG